MSIIFNFLVVGLYIWAFALFTYFLGGFANSQVFSAFVSLFGWSEGSIWLAWFMGKIAILAVVGIGLWPAITVARRLWWIGYGVSEEFEPTGELKVWKFKSAWLSVTADFTSETVRIQAKKSHWHDASDGSLGKMNVGRVNVTLPMSGLTHSLRWEETTSLGMTQTTGTGLAPAFVNGVSVMVPVTGIVNVPNGRLYTRNTGNQILTFAWRNVIKRAKKPTNHAGSSGAEQVAKIHTQRTDEHVDISVTLHSSIISRFEQPWFKVVKQIEALDEAWERELLAKAKAD